MVKNLLILPDGTELFSGVDRTEAIQSVTLTQCVNSGDELTMGSACADMLEVTAITPGGGLSLTAGDEVSLYQVDAAGQRRQVGIFILEKPTRPTANTMKLVGYDRIVKLEKDLTGWLAGLTGWPYSLLAFAKMVCAACDLTLENESIPNGDFQVQAFSGEGITGRQLMQWIGEACCRFCRATADGRMELAWYTPADISITPSGAHYYFQNGLSYEDYQVEQIDAVQLQAADSDDGWLWPEAEEGANSYVISGNPILCTHISEDLLPVLQRIRQELPTERYTPCKVCIPENPDIHPGNTVQITDRNGVTFTAFVMTKTNSGQKDTLECTGSRRRDSPSAVHSQSSSQKVRQIEIALKSIDGNKVVSMINLSESAVRIKGEKIQLEGTVTANENFKILLDGSIEAKAGKIGGCEIKDGKLAVPAAYIDGPLTIGQLPETVAEKADIPEVPKNLSGFTNDSGYQTESGVVSIIDGKINADYVNALGVTASRLVVKTGNGSPLFSAGDNQVQIAGWKVDSNSLYSGDSFSDAECFICTGSTGKMSIGGSDNINGWVLKAGDNFGVTKTGTCYLNSVHISGGMLRIPLLTAGGALRGYSYISQFGLSCTDIGLSADRLGSAIYIVPNGIEYESEDPDIGGQIITVEPDPASDAFVGYLNGLWYVGSLGSAVQVTSDRNAKYDIQPQPEVYSKLFDKLRPVAYKYKNGTSGRIHTGFIAQDVEDAVLSLGLTTQAFAGICYDLDENGDKVKYGIRYEEIVSMNTYEIQQLKRRVAELEAKIAQ